MLEISYVHIPVYMKRKLVNNTRKIYDIHSRNGAPRKPSVAFVEIVSYELFR